LTLAANLKPEQALDAMPDAVVMRLDDSGASCLVGELDESLIGDRAHEILFHCSSGRHRRVASARAFPVGITLRRDRD